MAEGKVKWFDPKKGFGFIEQENGEDLFVHQTSIISEGFRSLNEGDEVSFQIGTGKKGGDVAVDVKVVKALPHFLKTDEKSV